jgi:2-polyprenyl-3-methyl-5-hydroxy-6-metoxy-1,4-benzoquinol methylase
MNSPDPRRKFRNQQGRLALRSDTVPRRPAGAGRAALAAYRQTPLGTRLHATIRWWSAPFPAVEAELPPNGRILEIGCGHGLFCTYAALAGPSRMVRGVDIDAAKISVANGVASRLPGLDLNFDVATSGAVAAGPWDAIVVIDMLYLLPAAEQRKLLTAAAAQLAADGVLLIKEMSATPRWKARWNAFQETLSVSMLGITERAGAGSEDGPARSRFDFVSTDALAGWLRELGLASTGRRLDRRRLHPHHLLVARRSEQAIQVERNTQP